mmetsp:Transcript_14230/g.59550  ORF Transcript_14230/g.59550 Transcript_14230/m.59550 type:complete len:252 (-) Transcript_14230:194-949(-)
MNGGMQSGSLKGMCDAPGTSSQVGLARAGRRSSQGRAQSGVTKSCSPETTSASRPAGHTAAASLSERALQPAMAPDPRNTVAPAAYAAVTCSGVGEARQLCRAMNVATSPPHASSSVCAAASSAPTSTGVLHSVRLCMRSPRPAIMPSYARIPPHDWPNTWQRGTPLSLATQSSTPASSRTLASTLYSASDSPGASLPPHPSWSYMYTARGRHGRAPLAGSSPPLPSSPLLLWPARAGGGAASASRASGRR